MDDIDDIEDVLELVFSWWWGIIGSIIALLLLLWLSLYLLSLRQQYSLRGKHVLVGSQ